MSWVESLVEFCHASLTESVREDLWLRGVSDDQIDLYQLGYVDGELPLGDYPSTFLKWSHSGSKLVDSFVLPLTNWLGEVKGFQFRSVNRESKGYMDFFLDHKEPVFFGLGQAAEAIWETEEVCIVEGAFDLFPVQRALPQSISTLTAKVTGQLTRSFRRLTKKVIVFYDDDLPGRSASQKFVSDCNSELEIRLVEYPIGVVMSDGLRVKDPNDLWEAWGDERFSSYLKAQIR